MNLILAGILGYLALQLAVGLIVSRRVSTESDYLIAGRRLGYTLAIFSIFATWFGAETCIGAAGAVYEHGLSAISSDPGGYTICLLVMGLVFAVPLYRRQLTTLADLFRMRYSPGVERLAVLVMVPTSVLWAAAQVRAFGQVLSSASGFETQVAIGVATGVVILYTASGGLMADAVTDLIQGICLVIGLIVILVGVMLATGGPFGALSGLEPGRLRLMGGAGRPLLDTMEAWAIPIFGSVVAQELVARIIAAKSPVVARRSCLAASGIYFAMGLIPVLVGLAGSRLVPGLADAEQVLPEMARTLLPPVLYVVFAGALMSAILSTVDSTLLGASGLVSHNLILPLIRPVSEKVKLRISRGGVVCFGLLTYLLAVHAEGVYRLVKDASAFGSSGVFVTVAFGLFTRFGGPAAAAASLLAGALTWAGGTYLAGLHHPYLTSLAVALAAYAGVGALEPRRAGQPGTLGRLEPEGTTR